MKKFITFITTFAVMLAMLTIPAGVAAQEKEMDPAAVVVAVYEAVQAKDLDRAGTMLADDAVLVLVPSPPGTNGTFVGKEAVLGWYDNLIKNNFAIEFGPVAVSGNRVSVTQQTWVDDLPIAPVEFDGTGIVQNGLIKTLSWVITPESMAKLDAAMAIEANKAVIVRYLDELWNKGNLDVTDEIIADNFVSHTFPAGEGRAFMREMVTGFRAEFPGVTIILDDVVMAGNRAFVISHRIGPDGARVDANEELGGIPDILVFDLKDGQITDRWYFVPPE